MQWFDWLSRIISSTLSRKYRKLLTLKLQNNTTDNISRNHQLQKIVETRMLSSFLHSRTTSISKNPVYPQPTRGEFNSDKINGITEKRKAFESSLPIYTVSLRSIPRKFSHRGGRSRFNCKLERKILKRPLPPPLPITSATEVHFGGCKRPV